MLPIRSWLFVPGHRESMAAKALASGADAVILDLEDAVPTRSKPVARQLLPELLTSTSTTPAASDGAGRRRFVRVHALESLDALRLDLEAAVQLGLDGLVLPKVRSAEDVIRVSAMLDVWEGLRGVPRVRLLPLIEDPAGLLEAHSIAGASDRVCAIALGAEDYLLALGAMSGDAVEYARATLAVAAAAAGTAAVDRVWPHLDDEGGLATEARTGRGLGFSGKLLIHPRQIEAVHAAFMPTSEEVEAARAIVAAAEEISKQGAVSIGGQMVDGPVLRRAEQLLRRAGDVI